MMGEITLAHYLTVAGILFVFGFVVCDASLQVCYDIVRWPPPSNKPLEAFPYSDLQGVYVYDLYIYTHIYIYICTRDIHL